jgi:hypothetical protein
MASGHQLAVVFSILRCVIMNRIVATCAALSVLLGTIGLALAQTVNPSPYYSGGAPVHGQSMPAQQAAVPQSYVQPDAYQTAPVTDPHSSGTGGRAYHRGQKTN